MSARKKAIEIKKDEKEPVQEPSRSEKRKEAEEIVERYKKQNPWKYGLKKEALEKWIKSL